MEGLSSGKCKSNESAGALCIICCCAFSPSKSGGGETNTSTNSPSIDEEYAGGRSSSNANCDFTQDHHPHHKFSKFCDVVALKMGNKHGESLSSFQSIIDLLMENKISNRDRVGNGIMSICQNCLALISAALDTKEKVDEFECHLRALQLQILKGLRELEIILEQFNGKMGRIRRVVRESDVTCLQFHLEKMGTKITSSDMAQMEKNVFTFRNCILLEDGDIWIPRSYEPVEVKIEVEGIDEDESELDSDNVGQLENEQGSPCPPLRKNLRRNKAIPAPWVVVKVDNIPLGKRRRKRSNLTGRIKKKPITKTTQLLRGRSKSKFTRNKKGNNTRMKKTCDDCTFKTTSEPIFEQHLREHETEVKTFKCSMCTLQFSTNQYFQYHQKGHQGYYTMVCDVCSKRVPSMELADHLKSHLIDSSQIIFCQNCSFCCTSPGTYRKHLGLHLSKKASGKFICDICSDDLCSHGELLSHLDQVHGIGEKLVCGVDGCQKYFRTQQNLTVHRNRHSRINMKACPECSRIFMTVDGFEVHFRKMHSGETPFSCDLCPEKYATKVDVERHKIRSHAAPKYKCSVCEQEFVDKSYLKKHMRAFHDNKGCKCPHCGKIMITTTQLKRHLVSHTEERNWTCEECGKRFKHSTHLKIHMRDHQGIKDFKCSYCFKAFTRKDNLTLHLRTHTGEKPYVCDLCGKGFSQKTPLTVHKKNVHKDVVVAAAGKTTTEDPQTYILHNVM